MSGKTDSKKSQKTLGEFTDAFKASAEYVKPQWDAYLRRYQLWRGVKPPEMDNTISRIWINLAHSMVQQRLPLIFENVFSHPDYLTLKSDAPEYDLMADGAQAWLRDLLDDKIKIRSDAMTTVQTALIGGTGFRMPYVRYVEREGRKVPLISSKDIDFLNVLPSPNGSRMNPDDYHRDDAVDWVHVIDWWREDKIKAAADNGEPGWNKDQIGKLLANESPGYEGEEDNYKNQFKQINGMSYEGYGRAYANGKNVPDGMRKRRVVHWLCRTRHVIVAEDAYVIYDGKPPMGEGVIPLVKYVITPDLKNFYGISMIEMVEDLIMAIVMNFNYRMDHMLGVMFPTTWIRSDLWQGKSEDDFIPRPYSVNKFPSSVSDPRNAIFYDRRPEVSQQTFMDEDRMKSFLQSVSGELETSGSYGDVVGNRSATGVTTIAGALRARPNMEAAILEETGFREEITLLLKLGDIHINTKQTVPVPRMTGATAWREISPLDITDKFTVQLHGARYMADQQQSFQKLMSLYPYWNNNPGVDAFELNRQVASTHRIIPDPEKVFVPPAPPALPASPARPSASQGAAPGGAASMMNAAQAPQSMQRETSPSAQQGRTKELRVF